MDERKSNDPAAVSRELVSDCGLCRQSEQHPELILCEMGGWVLSHIEGILPLGTLLLAPKTHGLVNEVSAEQWREAAPLMELAPRLLTSVARAERVYIASFSEYQYHFHLVFFPKTQEMSRQHDGKIGPLLMAANVSSEPHDVRARSEVVAMYRSHIQREGLAPESVGAP